MGYMAVCFSALSLYIAMQIQCKFNKDIAVNVSKSLFILAVIVSFGYQILESI